MFCLEGLLKKSSEEKNLAARGILQRLLPLTFFHILLQKCVQERVK